MISGILGALTTSQIILIISLSVVGALCLVALGVFAYYKISVKRLRRPNDMHWLNKHAEVMRRIADMRSGRLKFVEETDEQEEERDIRDILMQQDDDDDAEEETESVLDSDEEDDEDEETSGSRDVLSVSSLSREMRKKLEIREKEYDKKRFQVHYDYSFEAKLRLSDEKTKKMYTELMDDILNYEGFEVRSDYRRERVCIGKYLYAVLRFIGNTFCVAFALDTEKYTGSEYEGLNKIRKDSFYGTPLVVRITSRRELDFAKYLLSEIAEANNLSRVLQPVPSDYDLSALCIEELYLSGMLRIDFLKELP